MHGYEQPAHVAVEEEEEDRRGRPRSNSLRIVAPPRAAPIARSYSFSKLSAIERAPLALPMPNANAVAVQPQPVDAQPIANAQPLPLEAQPQPVDEPPQAVDVNALRVAAQQSHVDAHEPAIGIRQEEPAVERPQPSRVRPQPPLLNIQGDARVADERQPLLGRAPQRPWYSRAGSTVAGWFRGFSNNKAKEAITVNTPGPQTGLLGGASAAVGLSSGPHASPPGATAVAVKPGAYLGAAQVGVDALGVASDVGSLLSAHALPGQSQARSAEIASARKRLAVGAVTNTADATGQGINAAQALGSTVSTASATIGHWAGPAVSGGVALRSGWRTGRALNAASNLSPFVPAQLPARAPDGTPSIAEEAHYHRGQLRKRAIRAGIGTAGAVAATIGGGLLAASMFTPVGWGLVAAGAAVGLGLGAWKLGRYLYKSYQNKRGTRREAHATNLTNAASSARASRAPACARRASRARREAVDARRGRPAGLG